MPLYSPREFKIIQTSLMTFVLIFAKHRNWTAALRDFTEILQQDPEDSKAYTYRARVYAKMVCVMNRFFRA